MIAYLSLVLDEEGKIKLDLKAALIDEIDSYTTKFDNSEAIREIYQSEIATFLNHHQNYIDKCSRMNRGRICITAYNNYSDTQQRQRLIEILPVFYKNDKKYVDSRRQKKMITDRLIADGNYERIFWEYKKLLPSISLNKINYGLRHGYTKTFKENKVRDGLDYIDSSPDAYFIFRQLCWEIKKLDVEDQKALKKQTQAQAAKQLDKIKQENAIEQALYDEKKKFEREKYYSMLLNGHCYFDIDAPKKQIVELEDKFMIVDKSNYFDKDKFLKKIKTTPQKPRPKRK